MKFYERVLSSALATERISNRDSVLSVCAGSFDRDIFEAAGFSRVTISNLDSGMGDDISPFRWERLDAEHIPHADGSFDIVAVHAGLHHCFSPHRAFLEMYRVARTAVIVIEARDSLALRLAVSLGLTDDYEIETTNRGGAGFTSTPNFVYRWTEREVRKTVAAAAPRYMPDIEFFHGLRLPVARVAGTGWRQHAVDLVRPFAVALQKLFPAQGNEFGWIVWKDRPVTHPWIDELSVGEAGLGRPTEAA